MPVRPPYLTANRPRQMSYACLSLYDSGIMWPSRVDRMERDEFEELVFAAIDSLPPEFRARLDNVDIFVQDWPTRDQLYAARARHRTTLLGLYEGVPLVKRATDYMFALPDRITLFQRPIQARCRTVPELAEEIRNTLLHEIGHHFGMDEERLRSIESDNRSRPRRRR